MVVNFPVSIDSKSSFILKYKNPYTGQDILLYYIVVVLYEFNINIIVFSNILG